MTVDEAIAAMAKWHEDGDTSCCPASVTCTLAAAVERVREVAERAEADASLGHGTVGEFASDLRRALAG